MAEKKKRQQEEGGAGLGWMVTFSDCMTLLLCFFVLLLTFSSFEEVKFEQLAGAFRTTPNDSIMENTKLDKESLLELPDRPNNTPYGSDMPTPRDPNNFEPRPPVQLLDIDVYRDRTVFYLPSDRLFWGRGVAVTRTGRDYLKQLSGFMTMVGSRIIIAESHGDNDGALGLRRAGAVMDELVTAQHVARSRFSVAADVTASRDRFGGRAFIEIALLNVKVEQ
ncbi:MAG: hypothetical protein GVY16_04800 [Planctomycetes bacterium]|jgi:outer membrane protein OmpA-like peptidoglycan-associated protein|nr:hypothetical protein [Phycisphaerae bacterium]NBB95041.1 hypothetical protein [Planctomycetota bacterium]